MREVSRRKKGCLMLFDLDRFRQINEQYGFIKGDIFLKISVQCIKKLREKMIIARFGGDEFAVWFHNINDEESAVRIVERFQKIVEEMILWESELEGMSFSIGVVIQDKENVSMSKMIQKADKALYMVKQQGGGGYHVHQENQEVTDKNQSQIDLEQLVAQIKQQDSEFDAIQQAYPELRRVFDVVSDIAQQKKQKVHLLLFTISYQDGDKMSVEEQERVMEYLERAVITSMEVDDFTTRYSGSQRIVVLSDKSKEQVDAVTSHIMKEFYKMYDRKEMSVSYQVADLSE
jgi:diguanylate cyclase (GGDEF)-like protein